MTKEEALKMFEHFAFSAYCRLQGWNKLAGKIAEITGKEGAIVSPVRCKWEPAK